MVDLFFILSGFLTIWTYKKATNTFTYIKKRFIRIYPTYWIYTLIVIIAYFAILTVTGTALINWIDMETSGITRSMLLIPTNVAVNEMPIIPPAWTLSYEVLFYIVSIILFSFGKKAYYTVILFWTSGIIFNVLFEINNLYISFIFSTLFLEFFSGILIAEMIIRRKYNKLLCSGSLSAGTILLCISWISENMGILMLNREIKFGFPFVMILYGICGIEQLKYEESINENSSKKALIRQVLAKISFSLYLVHYPLIVLFNSILHKIDVLSIISFIIIVTLCAVGGYISYVIIENPITQLLNKIIIKKKGRKIC